MNISDDAVEAGAAILVEMRRAGEHSSYEYAQAVLEAAAPHLEQVPGAYIPEMAQAWEEGFSEGLSAGRGSWSEQNPYKGE